MAETLAQIKPAPQGSFWRRARRARTVLVTLIAFALWEWAGQLQLIAQGGLPPPTDILLRAWQDRADYPPHVWATASASLLGFIIGNLLAITAGVIFVLFPTSLRVARGLNIAIYALPPIALSPILVLTLSGMAPRVVLAAVACYFVTMTATVIGLSQYDQRAADVIRAYGGGRWHVLWRLQIRGALPVIISGFQIAAPNAVLGAILAEFGGGGRWGLGTYLLGSLGRADPARLWGIGLAATIMASLAYLGFALLAARLLGASRSLTLNPSAPPSLDIETPGLSGYLTVAASIALPLIVWWAFIRLLDVPDMIAKTPWGVVDYLWLADSAASARERLLAALGQTLPLTVAGMLAGLVAAFALALASRWSPSFLRLLMPIALISQSMPLVALTPLLVLILGRGNSLVLWITISVTFFPAFVTLSRGLSLIPATALDVVRAYGASRWQQMRRIEIPASLPYLFAATRLTVPRALLGVMIAEWLATGTGLGNLLNQSRGYLDYGMVWSVASVSVILSVLVYQLVVMIERRVLHRLGMSTAE